jgi:hypothetical protein
VGLCSVVHCKCWCVSAAQQHDELQRLHQQHTGCASQGMPSLCMQLPAGLLLNSNIFAVFKRGVRCGQYLIRSVDPVLNKTQNRYLWVVVFSRAC